MTLPLDHARAVVAVESLDERQRLILVMISSGHTAQVIARAIGIPKHRVTTTVEVIKRTFDVGSLPEMAVIAARAGLV